MQIVGLSFLSTLQKILGTVFDAVLVPVIQDVANILINAMGGLISDILSGFLLRGFIIFLKFIYFLEQIFNIFSGISPIQVKNGDASQKMSLLNYFFQLDQMQTVFLVVTLLAVILAFVMTMISVGGSMSDVTLGEGKPISHILKQSMKAVGYFMIIPLTCLFLLQLTTELTRVVNSTMNEGNTSMSDVIFMSCVEEAAKPKTDVDSFRQGQKYEDAQKVKDNFELSEINYVMAFASSIFVILLMLVSILQFIQRIFEVLLLYALSPFFVATMPSDDGAKFKEWQKMFVAKVFSCFGPIIMMKIYFLVVPAMVSKNMDFHVGQNTQSAMELILVIGGAYAVYKGQNLMLTVLDPSASTPALGGMIGQAFGRIRGKAQMGKQKRNQQKMMQQQSKAPK